MYLHTVPGGFTKRNEREREWFYSSLSAMLDRSNCGRRDYVSIATWRRWISGRSYRASLVVCRRNLVLGGHGADRRERIRQFDGDGNRGGWLCSSRGPGGNRRPARDSRQPDRVGRDRDFANSSGESGRRPGHLHRHRPHGDPRRLSRRCSLRCRRRHRRRRTVLELSDERFRRTSFTTWGAGVLDFVHYGHRPSAAGMGTGRRRRFVRDHERGCVRRSGH